MHEGCTRAKRQVRLHILFYTSAEIGIAKPDKEIFEYVINDLAVEPTNITFIDDWDKNILTAKNLGIQAIQYQNIDQLKKELEL